MNLTMADANAIALDFLMDDLAIAQDDQEWFTILASRRVGSSWYVVEIGVEGLPDKWVLQVYDTGECDPNYTFFSPLSPVVNDIGLDELPEQVAIILEEERRAHVVP